MNLSRSDGIPAYDAAQDKYCPLTHTLKFQKTQLRRLKVQQQFSSSAPGARSQTPDALPAPSPNKQLRSPRLLEPISGAGRRRLERPGVPALREASRTSFSLSTLTGGITFGGAAATAVSADLAAITSDATQAWEPRPSVSPGEELEVLKAIVLREGYLKRLEASLGAYVAEADQKRRTARGAKSGHVVPPGLVDLLDLIRVATLEVVEAIQLWRLAAKAPEAPFTWNGVNYLAKIPSDLDDLDLFQPLKRWLGFGLKRNPFAIALPMEDGVSAGVASKKLLTGRRPVSSGGFTRVGAPEQLAAPDAPRLTDGQDHLLRQRREAKGPYQTPVVNDASLLGAADEPRGPARLQEAPDDGDDERRKSKGGALTSSVVGDVDMLRIRAAERVLLQEEVANGRFARDSAGRLTAVAAADREALGLQLRADDGRPLAEAATASRALAPYADLAGVGHQTQSSDEQFDDAARRAVANHAAPAEKDLGRGGRDDDLGAGWTAEASLKAVRRGGELNELTTMTTVGRRRAPTRRSKGAQLDGDIGRLRREAQRLGKEAEEVRAEMASDLLEVENLESNAARLEADEAARVSAGGPGEAQRAQRGAQARASAREKAHKLRDDVARADIKALKLEQDRGNLLKDATKRERERFEMKRSEKQVEDRRRAAVLEAERRMLPSGAVHAADERTAQTLEDAAATQVSRICRGRLARLFYARLRKTYGRAATLISAAARGRAARNLAKVARVERGGATRIERIWRGLQARVAYRKAKGAADSYKGARAITTMGRGWRARRRVKRRRELRDTSHEAAAAVHVRRLFPADLCELADAIRVALVDNRIPFPPAAVLGLMRIVVLLLSSGASADPASGEQVTEYSTIGNKHSVSVDRADLPWQGAVKVLRRSHRLLRRLRALAAGPASTPPRLLQMPPIALELIEAYDHDPTMTLAAMRRIGLGAKAATKLLEFVHGLRRVRQLQTDFFEDLGGDDSTPNWLARRRVGAKRRRALQAVQIVDANAVAFAEAACRARKAEGKAFGTQATCLVQERSAAAASTDALCAQDAAEAAHIAESVARIADDVQRAADDLQRAQRGVEAADADVAEAARRCREDASEIEAAKMPALRGAAQEARVTEREARVRLAGCHRATSLATKRRAKVIIDLAPEVRYRCVAAGEARAHVCISKALRLEWFRSNGGEDFVRRQADLDLRNSDQTRGTELLRMAEASVVRLRQLDAGNADAVQCDADAASALHRILAELEQEILTAEDAERARDAAPSTLSEPSDEERLEDAREDELCAVEELVVRRRYVPPAFLPALDREFAAEAQGRADAVGGAEGKAANTDDAVRATAGGQLHIKEDTRPRLPDTPPVRRQPLIVAMSRCVPTAARDKLILELEDQFEGLFVRVDANAPHGVDAAAFQAPLLLGRSVIANVDAGLTRDGRCAFVDGLLMAKAAVLPTPRVIVVLGDARNRRGPSPPAARGHYGVGQRDLEKMAQPELKQRFECCAEELANLNAFAALETLSGWSLAEAPPTRAHSLALEAAIILLQRSKNFRGPDSAITAMSWVAARRLLARPAELVAKLRDFDPATLPPATLASLKQYLACPDWPDAEAIVVQQVVLDTGEEPEAKPETFLSQEDHRGDDGVALGPLMRWVEAVVAVSDVLDAFGGQAPALSRRDPPDLLSSVIVVCDGRDADDEESEATGPRGWRAAFAKLSEAILEDCRAHRTASRLTASLALATTPLGRARVSRDAIYNINVYHDCGRVYFSAYDATRSASLFCSVREKDVDRLLAPNSCERAAHGAKLPPERIADMYARLVSLLAIERGAGHETRSPNYERPTDAARKDLGMVSAQSKAVQTYATPPRLVCKRRLHRLLRCTARISGYLCTVTIYEDARGELRVHVYVADRGASLELTATTADLRRCSTNAHSAFQEREALETADARVMLPFVADRLEVVPHKAHADDTDDGLACLAARRGASLRNDRTAGFALRVRGTQGPGRRLFRAKPVLVSGAKLLLTAYDCGASGVLRIRLYDPRCATTKELRLLTAHRAALLGSVHTDWRTWLSELGRRMSLNRPAHGDGPGLGCLAVEGLSVDAVVHRAVINVGNRRARVTVELQPDGESVLVRCFDVYGGLLRMDLKKKKKKKKKASAFDGLEADVSQKVSAFVVPKARLAELWAPLAPSRNVAESEGFSPVRHVLYHDVITLRNATRLAGGRVSLAGSEAMSVLLSQLQRSSTGDVILSADGASEKKGPKRATDCLPPPAAAEPPAVASVFGFVSRLPFAAHDGNAASLVRMRRQQTVGAVETAVEDRASYRYRRGRFVTVEDIMAELRGARPSLDADGAPERYDAPPPAFVDEPPPYEAEAPAALVTALAPDERLVYQQGVRVSVVALSPANLKLARADRKPAREAVYVKVWESFTSGPAVRELRFEVYRSTVSASERATVSGGHALSQVLGPKAQHLIAPEREAEMLHFATTERLVLHEGLWDSEIDDFRKAADRFTPAFTTDRIFDALSKVTPLGAGAEADNEANLALLFAQGGAAARGKKVLRQAVAVDGVLIHVVAFELPALSPEDEVPAPSDEAPPETSVPEPANAAPRPPTPHDAALDRLPEPPAEEFYDDSAREYDAPQSSTPQAAGDADAEPEASEAAVPEAAGRRVRPAPLPGGAAAVPRAPPLPNLRFVCYNPRAKHNTVFVATPTQIEAVLADLSRDRPDAVRDAQLRDDRHRYELAREVTRRLRLNFFRRAPPEVFLPTSTHFKAEATMHGADPEPVGLEDSRPGGPGDTKALDNQRRLRGAGGERKDAERVMKRPGRLLRMPTRVFDGDAHHQVVASVFAPPDAPRGTLDVNVYLSRFQVAVELRLDEESQVRTLGRTILSHEEGEARDSALLWLLRHLRLQHVPTLEEHKTRLKAAADDAPGADLVAQVFEPLALVFRADAAKPWLAAYERLDTSIEVPASRPSGIPGAFIPASTRGDEVLRRGISLPHGGEVLCTVFTRAPGEAAGHGLVFHVYDAQTSHEVELHLGASELAKHALPEDFEPQKLRQTVGRLLGKLKIDNDLTGGIRLNIDRPAPR